MLQDIKFKQVAVKDFATDLENGVIIANPPYGKRLKDREAAEKFMKKWDKLCVHYLHLVSII